MAKHPRTSAGASDAAGPSEPPGPSITVVGIGASAGGLAALKAFFQHVPTDSGLAFVVVVHLAPDHESHLAELLQPHVRVPVQQVTETTPLAANRVYVIPPGRNLSAVDTHLRLSDLEAARRERAPIDHFFRTLAATHDGASIGVVLTGTGSDGTLGVTAIKEKNGLVVVQDPADAEYDGMPQSAVATGVADLVLPLAAIPPAVLRFAHTTPRVARPADADGDDGDGDERQLLHKIFVQIRTRTGRDFTTYKRSTLLRRIGRRMQLRSVEELPAYLALLREEPDEVQALADDLLITVTSFFRDPGVFAVLAAEVVPRLFDGKGADDDVRVWSVGCATGEEAYSLAILLLEEAARREGTHPGGLPRLQLFASDLHDHSLARAREGFYPGDIATDVSAERLARFFVRENGGYRIAKEVRELVVFAPHNLLADPPFSKLDLVACRNVLIYLQRTVQHEIVDLFHYALRPAGFLVLGTSEAVDGASLFQVVDKKRCVYRKRNVQPPEPRLPVFPLTRLRHAGPLAPAERGAGPVAAGPLHERLVERYAPPSLLVSPDDDVVHLSEHAGRYLVLPGGEPTTNVYRLVREELRFELRSLVASARERGAPQRSRPIVVPFDGEPVPVVLHVRPALDPHEAGFALVIFDEHDPVAAQPAAQPAPADGARARELEAELTLLRHRLQSTVEEFETSQDELRASNEEFQWANEELRSTLEELETSKEELQSINEELQTVNQENRHRVEELRQLTGDLQNLLVATDIATLFLDRELRILRFTPQVGALFNVRAADRGRPLSDLTHRLGYPALQADARAVLDTLVPVEHEVQDDTGRWYLARLLPYRSAEHRIEGVVLTFVDITTQKQGEAAVRESEEKYRALFTEMDEAYAVVEVIGDGAGRWTDFRFLQVNPAFTRHTGMPNPVGRTATELLGTPNPRWAELYGRAVETGESIRLEEGELSLGRVFDLNVFRLGGEGSRRVAVLFSDITERERAEAALRESEERQALLLKLSDALRPLTDPIAVQNTAMEVLAERLGVMRASYFELEADGDSFHLAGRFERDATPMPERMRLSEFSPALGDAYRSGRTLTVPDTRVLGEFVEDPAPYTAIGVAAWAAVPLMRDGRLAAWIGVHSSTPREWSAADLRALDDVAERTWGAVERAKAEAALRRADARYRAMTDNVPILIWETDAGGLIFSNRHYTDFFGVSFDEVRAMGWAGFVHPDDLDGYSAAYHAAFARRASYSYECRFRRADGEYRWLLNTGHPLGDERFVGFSADITERKRAEAALRESEEKYRLLFEWMGQGYSLNEVVRDAEGAAIDLRYLELNPAFERLTGASLSEARGRLASEVFPGLDRYWVDICDRAVRSGVIERVEHELTPNGRWYQSSFYPIGRDRVLSLYDDITDRKLREQRRDYLLKLSDALRRLADPGQIKLEGSRVLGEALGVNRALYAEVVGDDWWAERGYVRDVDPLPTGAYSSDTYGHWIMQTYRRGESLVFEDVRADSRFTNQQRAAAESASIIGAVGVPLVKSGDLVALLSVHTAQPRKWTAHDIAIIEETAERTWAAVERARAEAALRASEEKYRELFERIDEGFCLLEVLFEGERPVDYRFLEVNPTFERHTGIRDATGRRMRDLAPAHEQHWFDAYGEVARTGRPRRFEARAEALGDRWYEVHAFRVGAPDQCRVAVVFSDITQRRRDAAALRASEARQAFLLTLNDALRTTIDSADLERTAVRLLGQHLGADRTFYATVDADGESWSVQHDYADGLPSNAGRYPLSEFQRKRLAQWQAGRLSSVADSETDPALDAADRAAYVAIGARAAIGVPVVKGGRFAALLSVNQTGPRVWTDAELALTREVAERTWLAIEHARAEAALRASEARYRTLVENVRDYAIFLLDVAGVITEWTPGAARVTGYAAGEAIGRHFRLFYPPEAVAAGDPGRELAEAAAAGRGEWEGWRVRQDGTRFWVNEIITAVRGDAGQLAGFTKIARDLTERRLAEEAAEQRRLAAARDELRRALAAAEEAERRRLARELHDQLGQHLTGFALGLADVKRRIAAGESAAARLGQLEALARLMTRDARSLALELRPPELDDVGLASALATYVHDWGRRSGVAAEVAVVGAVDDVPVEVGSALYRIAQEALTNVAKHAQATQVSVIVEQPDGAVRLLVEDDGRGFDPEATAERARRERRLGLAGMRERAALVGGTVAVESSPGAGTTLYVRLPLQRAAGTAAERSADASTPMPDAPSTNGNA